MSERFFVLESAGYLITPTRTHGGSLITEVMVIDRDYCHNVVWSSLTSLNEVHYKSLSASRKGGKKTMRPKMNMATARTWPLEKRRQYAADLAAQLNAEDAELMVESR